MSRRPPVLTDLLRYSAVGEYIASIACSLVADPYEIAVTPQRLRNEIVAARLLCSRRNVVALVEKRRRLPIGTKDGIRGIVRRPAQVRLDSNLPKRTGKRVVDDAGQCGCALSL